MHPLGVRFTVAASKGTALASVARSSLMMPSSAMRFRTTLRRSIAFSGFFTGLVDTGFCTRPASIAAWSSVRFFAVVPQ